MEEKRCTRCGKGFETRNDSDLCYSCTLHDLTGGLAPEEGDFNTAKIQSGTMTDEEFGYLQEDLTAVEEGRSIREVNSYPNNGYVDSAWCETCNKDTAFCECICYNCYEKIEDCKCTCALCDIPVKEGGLCPEHSEKWDEDVQGPIPGTKAEVANCVKCGVYINTHFWLNNPWSPRIQPTAYNTGRNLCMKCDTEGKFDQKK
jgi:hypothetical protein